MPIYTKQRPTKYEFAVSDYPRSRCNENKAVVSEGFEKVHGQEYLQRVYADGSGDLTRFDEETGMWTIISCPATVDDGIEDKIRSVIRNNFDVGVCLKRHGNEMKAA